MSDAAPAGRRLFDSVAAEYDAMRPDYPAQLFDALESAMGGPLLWSEVLDVGAGTGISTRALAGRGATVTAVDPGIGVIATLRARSTSRVLPLVADGNALPLRDGRFDLVTYAQSFHWTDPSLAVGEAFRVLKPGGVLAAWWNRHDLSVPWVAAHQDRFRAACGQPAYVDESWVADLLAAPPWSRRVAVVEIPWSRRVSLEDFGRSRLTVSYVFDLGDRARAVVDAELAELAEVHPEGVLDEPFTTYAVMARR